MKFLIFPLIPNSQEEQNLGKVLRHLFQSKNSILYRNPSVFSFTPPIPLGIISIFLFIFPTAGKKSHFSWKKTGKSHFLLPKWLFPAPFPTRNGLNSPTIGIFSNKTGIFQEGMDPKPGIFPWSPRNSRGFYRRGVFPWNCNPPPRSPRWRRWSSAMAPAPPPRIPWKDPCLPSWEKGKRESSAGNPRDLVSQG